MPNGRTGNRSAQRTGGGTPRLRTPLTSSIAALTLLLLRSGSAAAQTPERVPVTVDWEAPAECPDRAHLVAEIERLLGHAAETSVSQTLAAHATVHAGEQGTWELRLDTTTPNGSGTRTIEGQSCLEIADATALILAMAIDPEAIRAVSDSSPPPDPPHVASPAPLPASPAPDADGFRTVVPDAALRSSPQHGPIRPWRVVARAGVSVDFGTFAAAAAGPELAVGILFPRFRIETTGTYFIPQFTSLNRNAPAGGEFSMFEAGLRGCFTLARAPIADLETCARADLGSMIGTGRDVVYPITSSGLWLGVMAGFSGGFSPVPALSFRASIDGGVTALAPTFVVTGLGEVYRPSSVFVRGQVAIEVRF